MESIQPDNDSPSDKDHADSVPTIHPASTSDENLPVQVGSKQNDDSPSHEVITPPVTDQSSILSDESDESIEPKSIKTESTSSDLAKEKDRNSGNLVGRSNESTSDVSGSNEVKSIDALMNEVMITYIVVWLYLLILSLCKVHIYKLISTRLDKENKKKME